MNSLSLGIFLQISCLRAEQTQLTRSLEKERQRAAENRQEYLALKEEADTNESRVNQLEGELKEYRKKHKEELHEALMHQELLQQVGYLILLLGTSLFNYDIAIVSPGVGYYFRIHVLMILLIVLNC